ncbi:MAG TPA: hypothetical protein VFU51_00800 [Gaiellaceae bacterium]|nr:hypothetical protein [Gaiellaceae bacterium]
MIDVEPLILSELERMRPLPDGGRADWSDVLRRAGLRTGYGRSVLLRRRWPLVAIGVTAVLAAILAVTPAWALVRDVLPFWGQPSAPSSVKVDFSHLNRLPRGLPAGMSPHAVSGDAREIEQATIGGETKTLWVAPATGHSHFCWVWGPHLAGGCPSLAEPLGVMFMTIPPHDPSQPAQTTNIPAHSGYPEHGVPFWVTGSALSSGVSDVVIRFSDGSSVHPHIVWVSAPINAGFFAYDIPSDRQSSEDHATAIEAYDGDGKLVSKQTITGG